MAPKKSAGEEQGPTLKLIIENGPLSGTTREFRPGVTVRIGRLVRGNTFAIKDAGISSNHLLFQSDAADGRRWTVTNLDSSNGTIFNGVQLQSSESAVLSHGDVVKIGELTSIRVEMVSEAESEVGSGVRRNARRRVRADLGVIEENAELGLQNKGEIEVEVKQGRSVNTRRTRSSAKNVDLAEDLNVKGSRGVRTRSSKKEENIEEIGVDLSVIEGKKTTRGGRGRKKQKLCVETIAEETEKEELNPQHETREEEEERSEIGVDESGFVTEGVAAGASSSAGVQEGEFEGVKGKMVVDLEKMSLGEWLDYLEEYIPQQIIVETEEMLAEMRRKAERCHEYMLEQKKKKAQGS